MVSKQPKTKRFNPPPVPYSEHLKLRKALAVIQSQWQALLEENHELRMKLKSRPTTSSINGVTNTDSNCLRALDMCHARRLRSARSAV